MKKILYAVIFCFARLTAMIESSENAKLYEIPHEKSPALLALIPQDVWIYCIFSKLIPKQIKNFDDLKHIRKLKLVSKYFYELCDSDKAHMFISPDLITSTILLNTKKKREKFNLVMLSGTEREITWIFQTALVYEVPAIIRRAVTRGANPNLEYGKIFKTNVLCNLVENNKKISLQTLLDIPQTDPNQADEFTMTPLMLAARHNHIECLQQLLAHPLIDPGITNRHGRTALGIANHEHRVEAAALLLQDLNRRQGDQGNNLDQQDDNNQSCLCIPTHCAIS